MTNTTTVTEQTVFGNKDAWFVNVDITSLGAAGTEAWVPEDEIDALDADELVLVGSHESEAYRITFDHTLDQFDVVNVADGTDVTSGTDVGEVELLIVGV